MKIYANDLRNDHTLHYEDRVVVIEDITEHGETLFVSGYFDDNGDGFDMYLDKDDVVVVE